MHTHRHKIFALAFLAIVAVLIGAPTAWADQPSKARAEGNLRVASANEGLSRANTDPSQAVGEASPTNGDVSSAIGDITRENGAGPQSGPVSLLSDTGAAGPASPGQEAARAVPGASEQRGSDSGHGHAVAAPAATVGSEATSTPGSTLGTNDPTGNAPQPDTTPADHGDTTGGGEGNKPDSSQQPPTQGVENPGASSGQKPQAGADRSNTTTQEIWQVQSLGCIAHCQGTKQTQSAQQQNTTVEVAPADAQAAIAPAGDGSKPASQADSSPKSATEVTQIQIGCIAHCFGTTTTASSDSSTLKRAIEQMLSAASLPGLPTLEPIFALQQNVVQQGSEQAQDGQGLVAAQAQKARQTSTTEQTNGPVVVVPNLPPSADPSSLPSGAASEAPSSSANASDQSSPPERSSATDKPAAGSSFAPGGDASPGGEGSSSAGDVFSIVTKLVSALGDLAVSGGLGSPKEVAPGSPMISPSRSVGAARSPVGASAPDSASSPVAQVVNQVAQGIWQLQIGCLVFCVQTSQSQSAEQSDSTVWVVPQTDSPSAARPGGLTTTTSQLIWQLQIGCVFWCSDAVEIQTAATGSTLVTVVLPLRPPSPPDPGSPTPNPGPPSQAPGSSAPDPAGAGNQTVAAAAPATIAYAPSRQTLIAPAGGESNSRRTTLRPPLLGTPVKLITASSSSATARRSEPATAPRPDALAPVAAEPAETEAATLTGGPSPSRPAVSHLRHGSTAPFRFPHKAGPGPQGRETVAAASSDDTATLVIGLALLIGLLLGARALLRSR